jgi:hypothetical protein
LVLLSSINLIKSHTIKTVQIMKTIFNGNYSEVTNKNRLMQRKLRIIQAISQNGTGITVPDICKKLEVSAPHRN